MHYIKNIALLDILSMYFAVSFFAFCSLLLKMQYKLIVNSSLGFVESHIDLG